MDNRSSNVVEPNFIESNIKNPEQFFEVVYLIRNLGSISFFIVNLKEKIENNSEEITVSKELEENIPLKRYSSSNSILNKKFRKLTSQQSIKYNNLVSGSSKSKEEENIEEHEIKRKSKTKVFFPIISGKSSNKILNLKGNQKKEEKINKMKSLNTSEVNKDNLLNKIKDNNCNSINNNLKIKRDSKEIKKALKTLRTINNKDNLKLNKLLRKENFDEDENTELIPKDKFNEILKNLNKKNRIFIIILFFLIILSFIILLSKFIICMNGFEKSQALLKSMIYLEMIKVDIYSLSLLSMIYCLNDTYVYKLSDIHKDEIIKKKKVLEHLKLFQETINSIINDKNCLGISKILNKRFKINTLNIDWSVLESKTSFLEEIRKISFKIYELINNNQTCDLDFIKYFNKDEKNIKNYDFKANNMEKILFYFLNNSLRVFRIIFNELIIECEDTILKMFSNYQIKLIYLLISIIMVLVLFVIFYIIKACYDYSYYQFLFLYYYHIENDQIKFENQIYYLYKVIQEFNIDNIKDFEHSKNSNNFDFKYLNDNINNGNDSNKNDNLNNNINVNTNKFNSHNSLLKKNNKKNSVSIKNSIDVDKNNINLLNGSINGSSFQLLNYSNHNKNMLNNNLPNNKNSRLSIHNEKEEKEDSIDSLLNISKKILPDSIKISLISIIVGVIIYIPICNGNLYEAINEKNMRTFSINLSMNILERIPNLMALLIYSLVSIINNNPNQIYDSTNNENQPKYLTYFKANSLYYSEEIMNKYFKNSIFGSILRENLRVNYNFNNYLYQDKYNIFTLTKYYETLLNKEGYFCIYGSIGDLFLNTNFNNYTSYDFVKELNENCLTCKYFDLGIDESGVKLEINYILQELINKFIEFITYNNSNITINQAKDKYFGSPDIKRIFLDMQYPLILYYNTIIYAVYYDFEEQGNSFKSRQSLLDLLLFTCNVLIIICLLCVVTKGEKYKRLFAYFLEIPKNHNN